VFDPPQRSHLLSGTSVRHYAANQNERRPRRSTMDVVWYSSDCVCERGFLNCVAAFVPPSGKSATKLFGRDCFLSLLSLGSSLSLINTMVSPHGA
jgi:hypothetical protein